MKSKNGKPPTKLIDNYGKIVRLSKADMSRMQDLASIATGMERGVASDKVHLDAQRYKAQVIARESTPGVSRSSQEAGPPGRMMPL